MYLCVDFAYFYEFSIGCWSCSTCVILIVFHLIISVLLYRQVGQGNSYN